METLPHVKGLSQRTPAEKDAANRKDKESHRALKALQKVPGNEVCADCTAKYPGWAALPHGIMVCVDCAQLHRHIGRHLSQVKAINTGTYLWYDDEVEAMRAMGNRRAADLYLFRCPQGRGARMPEQASRAEKEQFIRNKYEHKKWIATKEEVLAEREAAVQSAAPAKSAAAAAPAAARAPPRQTTAFSDDFAAWPSASSAPAPAPAPAVYSAPAPVVYAAPAPATSSAWQEWSWDVPSMAGTSARAATYDSRKAAIMSMF